MPIEALAYMIVTARITDAGRFAEYAACVPAVLAQHGGRLIGRTTAPVSLEGDFPWQTVGILEFASVPAAQAFWHSPEYEAIKPLREDAAEFQVVLVEGAAPPADTTADAAPDQRA